MITLRKNGYRVEFEGDDNRYVRRDYNSDGRLLIISTFFDCSLDESIKKYLADGWSTKNIKYNNISKKIKIEENKVELSFAASLLIIGCVIAITHKLIDDIPLIEKEIKKYAKK